jgi:hypothetical protein
MNAQQIPPPMPDVAAARIPMQDVAQAAARAAQAWNRAQMEDAIRSAEFFLARARVVLAQSQPTKESEQ